MLSNRLYTGHDEAHFGALFPLARSRSPTATWARSSRAKQVPSPQIAPVARAKQQRLKPVHSVDDRKNLSFSDGIPPHIPPCGVVHGNGWSHTVFGFFPRLSRIFWGQGGFELGLIMCRTGIEPSTFRPRDQCFNHYTNPAPLVTCQ